MILAVVQPIREWEMRLETVVEKKSESWESSDFHFESSESSDFHFDDRFESHLFQNVLFRFSLAPPYKGGVPFKDTSPIQILPYNDSTEFAP